MVASLARRAWGESKLSGSARARFTYLSARAARFSNSAAAISGARVPGAPAAPVAARLATTSGGGSANGLRPQACRTRVAEVGLLGSPLRASQSAPVSHVAARANTPSTALLQPGSGAQDCAAQCRPQSALDTCSSAGGDAGLHESI